VRVTTIRTGGGTAAARVDGNTLTMLPFGDVGALLQSGPGWIDAAASGGQQVEAANADYAPLVPWPEKIFCVGLNYRAHVGEGGVEVPDYPMVFAKYARSLIGPFDDLRLPPNSKMVDWEAELAIVVGKTIRYGDETEAEAAIAGYTILNDVSMRDWQLRTSEYLQGKTFEGSTPLGPYLVTPDECGNASDLRVTLDVDGEVMQDASTADLIFPPATLVAYLSQIITLVPGDVIATGTPAGVGAVKNPPRFLQAGELMTAKVEGLGEQQNRVVAPK
jgi:acylpyruvate hydrolase